MVCFSFAIYAPKDTAVLLIEVYKPRLSPGRPVRAAAAAPRGRAERRRAPGEGRRERRPGRGRGQRVGPVPDRAAAGEPVQPAGEPGDAGAHHAGARVTGADPRGGRRGQRPVPAEHIGQRDCADRGKFVPAVVFWIPS